MADFKALEWVRRDILPLLIRKLNLGEHPDTNTLMKLHKIVQPIISLDSTLDTVAVWDGNIDLSGAVAGDNGIIVYTCPVKKRATLISTFLDTIAGTSYLMVQNVATLKNVVLVRVIADRFQSFNFMGQRLDPNDVIVWRNTGNIGDVAVRSSGMLILEDYL